MVDEVLLPYGTDTEVHQYFGFSGKLTVDADGNFTATDVLVNLLNTVSQEGIGWSKESALSGDAAVAVFGADADELTPSMAFLQLAEKIVETQEYAEDTSNYFITGTYSGNGTYSREISLGFQPKAILIFNSYGQTYASLDNASFGGLAFYGYPSKYVSGQGYGISVTTSGFTVGGATSSSYIRTNTSGYTYYYLAFK